MVSVVTSLSRVFLITFAALFALVDIISIFTRKEEIVNDIINVALTVLMVCFLANASLVIYVNTKDDHIPFLFIGQLILFIVANFGFSQLLKYYNKVLFTNVYMFITLSFISLERLDVAKSIRQFLFAVLSVVICMFILAFIQKISFLKNVFWLYGAIGILLLAIVFMLGKVEYGAKLSLSFGSISIQPSEFVKILFVFFIASCVYKFDDLKGFILSTVGALLHVVILAGSKDFGCAFILLVCYGLMIFVAYKNYVILMIEIAAGIGMSYVAYLKVPHIQTRVLAWLDPLSVVDNEGYQISQSLFAIGTGSWLGSGLYQGAPNKIPVVAKDFIFSAIAEELGGIVAISIVIMFLCTILHMLLDSMDLEDKFYTLISLGLTVIFATQTLLNIGGVTRYIPSTGVTLPFISYGGSSFLACFISISIIQKSKDLVFLRAKRKEVIHEK